MSIQPTLGCAWILIVPVAIADDMPDVEVRWEDQQNINEFGRMNHRLKEVQEDSKTTKV